MGRRRAIQKTLGRLGMQVSNQDVVAALAEGGMSVTEELVRQVKIEMLKEASKVERQSVTVPDHLQRRQIRLPLRIPPSKSRASR
jgi:hypothetical protein